MIIYPAIDIKDGKCVRLRQGNFNDVTVFGENPAEIAKSYEENGAEFIHVVDLDGARSGEYINFQTIKSITESVSVPVQVGGGIRSLAVIEEYIKIGVSRLILGTAAVNNREFVTEAILKYGDKIAIGIDAKDGFVAIDGWETLSEKTAVSFAKEMEKIGAKTIIYTDISTDGMLMGPNVAAMDEMAESVSCDIIASGGVSTTNDVRALCKTKVSGAIIGKALYMGNIDLKEAITAGKGEI